jgi:hypothetical protein
MEVLPDKLLDLYRTQELNLPESYLGALDKDHLYVGLLQY